MKATRRPFGNACISTGNGYAFDPSAAGAAGAEAATSAARSESIMRFLRGAAHGSRHQPRIKESSLHGGFFGAARPEGEAVFAGGLGFVHGGVGAVEEELGGVGGGFEPRHSDGGADVE